MLINESIPNLIQGISQQPSTLRLPTQAEIQLNCYSSLVEGLKKRPGTVHVAKLRNTTAPDAFVHTINRDSVERYVVVLLNGGLEVYDMAGNAKVVNFPSGTAYLNATTPRDAFACVTVADYTFIVNKTVSVAMSAAPSGWPANVCYFHVTNAIQNITYAAQVDGITATYAAGAVTDSNSVTSSIGTNLAAALGAGYTISYPAYNVIKVTKTAGSISSAGSSDGWGNNALKTIFQRVQKFSDLPQRFETGYPVYIAGDNSTAFSGYYVQWDVSGNTGVWKECVKPGIATTFDANTMPWRLVRNAGGDFTFDKVTWDPRNCGDDNTNALPSFVGRKISEVFYYRNRLGVCADENVILSKTANFFNFWIGTATTASDTDRIDVSAVTTKVALLKFAVPFADDLLLFSPQQQFKLTAPATSGLTPKTVQIKPTTAYEMVEGCRPVAVGQDAYFATNKGQYTSLRDYYVQPGSTTNTAEDVSAHAPSYLPTGTFKLIAGLTENVVMALNTTQRNNIHVYKFAWDEEKNQRIQSSWGHWAFGSDAVILGGEMIDSKLYLAIQRTDGVYLEYMDLQPYLVDTDLGYHMRVDRRVALTGVYDSVNDWTTWTLPYTHTFTNLLAVLSAGFGATKGSVLNITRPTSSTVRATGDFTAAPVYIGRAYTAQYRFSELIFRQDGNVVLQYKMALKYMRLIHQNTGAYTVTVTPLGRGASTYTFTGMQVGSLLVGSTTLDSGSFRFPLICGSAGCVIEIQSTSHLPFAVQSAEWNANVNFNFRRQ